jgi:hypothetical protein
VKDIQDKEKALLRLLCHYLVYIGNTISTFDRSCDPTKLLSEWTYDWNKPATFGGRFVKTAQSLSLTKTHPHDHQNPPNYASLNQQKKRLLEKDRILPPHNLKERKIGPTKLQLQVFKEKSQFEELAGGPVQEEKKKIGLKSLWTIPVHVLHAVLQV